MMNNNITGVQGNIYFPEKGTKKSDVDGGTGRI